MLKVWNSRCFLAQNTCYQKIDQKFGSSYSTVKKYKKNEILQNHKYENPRKLTWKDFLFLPQQRYTNFSIRPVYSSALKLAILGII